MKNDLQIDHRSYADPCRHYGCGSTGCSREERREPVPPAYTHFVGGTMLPRVDRP